ncbi:MAG: hypothetical protein AAF579_01870 [Cyanobacteria bacterium P01_C01_bin.118]
MTIENAIAAIGLLGIGGIFGTYFRILWERKNTTLLQKQEFKEARYKCIILLIYSALDFDKNKVMLRQQGRKFLSREDLMDELKAEWHNMILFASDGALMNTHTFIKNPSYETFRIASLAMRKDLWGGKLSPSLKTLSFDKM